jgi:hypothetical protein
VKETEAVKLLSSSNLFDEKWYMECYSDVEMSNMSPVLHYLRYGWLMMRDPSSSFSTSAYLERNNDVKKQGENPLVHFIFSGKKEGRKCFPSNTPVNKSIKSQQNKIVSGCESSSDAVSNQLEKTQALLEHYFNRCKELEYSLPDHQFKHALESK